MCVITSTEERLHILVAVNTLEIVFVVGRVIKTSFDISKCLMK